MEKDHSSLADHPVITSEQGHAYIKQFGVTCSAIHNTNHCYQSVPRISIILRAQNRPVALGEGDLSQSELYEGPLSYAEGSPLTFTQSYYTAL